MIQCVEGRGEQGTLEFSYCLSGSDALPGSRFPSGVSMVRSRVRGQMSGGSEVLARDFGEDPCSGPDANAGYRGQDLMKRVVLHEGFDPGL